MTADDPVERELMFHRFRGLVLELIRGETKRTAFEPWEVEILIDIENCSVPAGSRIGALRRYLTVGERQLAHGPGPPMKFSDFLEKRNRRRR